MKLINIFQILFNHAMTRSYWKFNLEKGAVLWSSNTQYGRKIMKKILDG